MNKLLPVALLIAFVFVATGCGNRTKKKQDEIASQQARATALEESRTRRLEAEKQEREQKAIREAYAKEAPIRNAEKIKRLGLAPALQTSIIYSNFIGTWTQMMPADRWVGLLLENPKINSIEAINYRGMPGVFIKRPGRPGVGFIFRVEGSEAYPHALVSNGLTQTIYENEQGAVALTMMQLTNAKAMD